MKKSAKLFFTVILSIVLIFSACKKDKDEEKSGLLTYIAGFRGLYIIDVTDQTRPIQVAFLELDDSLIGLALKGRYIYALYYNTGKMTIIDVDDHENPVVTGSTNLPGRGYKIAISESGYYAYIGCGDDGLKIVDISIPSNPSVVGSFDTDGFATGIAVKGNNVYLADSDAGLYIIDVSNPHTPVLVSRCLEGSVMNSISITGNMAYITATSYGSDYTGCIHAVDISNPSSPVVTGYTPVTDAINVFATSSYICVLNWGSLFDPGGFHVYSSGSEPSQISSVTGISVGRVVVRNDYAYVSGPTNFIIFDLGNINQPERVSTYELSGNDLAIGIR
jgi:hypothetical protein